MGDGDTMTIDELRRMYAKIMRGRYVGASGELAMAAEIRQALAFWGAAVFEAAADVPAPASPWRSVATDPPPMGVLVLCAWVDVFELMRRENGEWISGDDDVRVAPDWWTPIPAVPAVAP